MARANGARTHGLRSAETGRSRETTGTRGRAVVSPSTDPMARVLATGPRLPLTAITVLAMLLHVGAAAAATAAARLDEFSDWERLARKLVAHQLSSLEVDVVKETPPPPPEPEPPPPEPEPEAPKPVVVKETVAPHEAAPKPAEAGQVLAADPKPDEPVNMTDSFVTGSGSTYAGGRTSSDGTSKTAVYNPAAAHSGTPGGVGTVAAPVVRKEDKSRAPGLLGSVDWNDCPFPAEADAEQIDQAYVLIQVKVKPDGSPEMVSVVQDPGHGFGREARRCAMRKRYSQGLDPDGNPMGGSTKPFRVRFER